MFTAVYHVTCDERHDVNEQHIMKLLKGEYHLSKPEEFHLWNHDMSNSLVWKPMKSPPLLEDHDGSTKVTTREPGLSPLMKLMLQKHDTTSVQVNGENVKWCCSHMTKLQGDMSTKNSKSIFYSQMKDKAEKFGFPITIRGKWVIMESELNTGCTIENLWDEICAVVCSGVIQHCNVVFQKDCNQLLLYTDFAFCVTVLDSLQSILNCNIVKRMSYVVHPYGEMVTYFQGKLMW